MPRFAANLSWLYQEIPFLDRFAAAARDGFRGVEILSPYEWPAEAIAAQLAAHGLELVLLNAPAGDWAAGERGLACLPGRETAFRESIAKACAYAKALRCSRMHVMAGIAPADADRAALASTCVHNLRFAAREAAAVGANVLIEPINTRDMPGYFLTRQDQAHALVADIGLPNVQVQMDLYHAQITEGDLAMKLRHWVPAGGVGHMQVAGVPERGEPDIGEVNHAYLFALIDELGYDGWIGCEYRPKHGAVPNGTSQGLGWLAPYIRDDG